MTTLADLYLWEGHTRQGEQDPLMTQNGNLESEIVVTGEDHVTRVCKMNSPVDLDHDS